jgi:uncharacterized protein (DUF305 family)
MNLTRTLRSVLLLSLAVGTAAGCSSATASPADARSRAVLPEPPLLPFSAADVEFMTSMIPHHAQAVVMGRLAAERSGRADVRVLAERIVVAQRDEIALMRTWLADRKQHVPAADATHHRHVMDGVEHDMLMPGMLTSAELAELERARGAEFDRLFLTFMIRHHEGAVAMVEKLFASYGAAQDEVVFRFASDVFADQTTEIDRMEKMLETLPAQRP